MALSRDVLAYIDWVWDLQWREQQRRDPTVQWQRDLSWNEIAACAGYDETWLADLVQAPGDLASSEVTWMLYWPALGP